MLLLFLDEMNFVPNLSRSICKAGNFIGLIFRRKYNLAHYIRIRLCPNMFSSFLDEMNFVPNLSPSICKAGNFIGLIFRRKYNLAQIVSVISKASFLLVCIVTVVISRKLASFLQHCKDITIPFQSISVSLLSLLNHHAYSELQGRNRTWFAP